MILSSTSGGGLSKLFPSSQRRMAASGSTEIKFATWRFRGMSMSYGRILISGIVREVGEVGVARAAKT